MNQLSHVHLLQRLWKSELETVQIETDYFLSVIEDLRKRIQKRSSISQRRNGLF